MVPRERVEVVVVVRHVAGVQWGWLGVFWRVLADGGWPGGGVGVNRGGHLPGGGDGGQLTRGHRDSGHQRHQPCHLQQNNQQLIKYITSDYVFAGNINVNEFASIRYCI